jgi:putative hydrolase of the HAD superfamily
MANTTILSFDMDGTITDLSFAESVWLEGVPSLYANKKRLTFDEARNHVKNEYDKVGRQKLEWYDLNHWIKKFGLEISKKEILRSFRNRIRIFPEVEDVLKEFRGQGYKLIIVSNARREFISLQLKRTKIEHYFERIFSSTSDFNLTKQTVKVYQQVSSIMEVSPTEMIHVGDDLLFDFVIPQKLGIKSFYLDRTGKKLGNSIIHNLRDLKESL